MPSEEDLDTVAEQLFEAPYHHLSAWGQAQVESAMGIRKSNKIDAPYNQALDNLTPVLSHENERLARIVEDLQRENAELWAENQDLRMELLEKE